jgi:hypothetical protein
MLLESFKIGLSYFFRFRSGHGKQFLPVLILYSDGHYPSLLTQQFSGSVLRAKVKKPLLKVKIEKNSKLPPSLPVQLHDLNSFSQVKQKLQIKC